jgi:alkanesulfonate monooxygenase SsuD/methylene tetrahydromethanopterin reductase-like flavin-dependent oxidoreductase (luciferase family)
MPLLPYRYRQIAQEARRVQPDLRMHCGIILSNRGVLLGLNTVRQLLALADAVEASPLLDSVWVGDALFVNQRLDAFTLLAAIAGRTERVLMGPACMGSFALRDPRVFAYEWASLDVLSNGRTRLAVCSGGGGGAAWDAETAAMGLPPAERRRRMIENMHALRHLWTRDDAPFEGRFVRFGGITLEPKPVQSPCPIWLTTNVGRLSNSQTDMGGTEFALTRVARVADGWMTHSVSPEGFRRSWDFIQRAGADAGRDMACFDNTLCHNVNIGEDSEAALADAKQFLDRYYGANYSRERLVAWLAYGPPHQVIAQLRGYVGSGCNRIALRLATMGDAANQFRRLTEEVLPFVNADPVASAAALGVS